ncbi:O-Antigen ligase [compost metagenome]
MQRIKKVIAFLFLFMLFYLEPIQVFGNITFSQLWKIPFVLFLLFKVLTIKNPITATFTKVAYGRAIKNLMNGGMFRNYIPELIDFIRYMMFPLIYTFVLNTPRIRSKVDVLLKGFAQFIILSGIPFILGMVESLGRTIEIGDDFTSFVGLFQNPHVAAISTAVSLLVILYYLNWRNSNIVSRAWNIFLFGLGLYILFQTFVRTGYVTFLLGIFILYMPKRISPRQIAGIAFLAVASVFTISYLLENNELFFNRIFDIRNGKQTELGSGRLIFWAGVVEMWLNGNLFHLLFGFGYEALTDSMYLLTGLRIFAHSEFFTQLGQNGLIGIILFVWFVFSLFLFIRKRKQCKSYRLALAVFFLNLSVMLTQGGVVFPLDVITVFILVKLTIEFMQLQSHKTIKHGD